MEVVHVQVKSKFQKQDSYTCFWSLVPREVQVEVIMEEAGVCQRQLQLLLVGVS
jgi:hypothetical protein